MLHGNPHTVQYNVVDFDAIGGLPPVMKHLLAAGLLHGNVLTGVCVFIGIWTTR